MLKALVKDTAIYGFVDFAFKLLSFFTFPIFAYLFTVEEFGILSLLTTTTGLLTVFLGCGISNSVVRYYWDPTLEKSKSLVISTGFYFLTIWSIGITLCIIAISYGFQDTFNREYPNAWLCFIFAILGSAPALLCQFCIDVLRLYFTPWKFAQISSLQNSLTIALSILFVWKFHWGIAGFLAATSLGALFTLPLAIWSIRKDLLWAYDRRLGKKLFRFGYPFIFVAIAYWIFGSMDRWMLAELSSVEQTGMYSIAFKIGTIMFFFQTAISQAWNPRAMHIHANDPNAPALFSNFLNILFFFLVLLGSILSLFSKEVLYVLTPAAYWPAAVLCPVICMGLIFSGTNQVSMLGFYFAEKVHFYNVGSWMAAGVNFGLNLLLIPHFHALGAAIATFASYLILTCFYLVCSQRYYPIPLNYAKLGGCLGMTLLITIVASWLNEFSPTWEMICIKGIILVGVIVSGVAMKIFDWRILLQKAVRQDKMI